MICVCIIWAPSQMYIHTILAVFELPCPWCRMLNLLNLTGLLQSHCSSLARSHWMVPSFRCVTCPAQLPVSCKGAGGALDPTHCTVDNDIKKLQCHGQSPERTPLIPPLLQMEH